MLMIQVLEILHIAFIRHDFWPFHVIFHLQFVVRLLWFRSFT